MSSGSCRLARESSLNSFWRHKKEVISKYDASSHTYDELYGEEQEAKYGLALKLLPPQQKETVADIGCGTGLLCWHLLLYTERLVAVDVSVGMLGVLKSRRVRSSGLAIVRADADFLPFKDEVFGAAYAITLLQNSPNPRETVRELARVLRRGGRAVVSAPKKCVEKQLFAHAISTDSLKVEEIVDSDYVVDFLAVCKKL